MAPTSGKKPAKNVKDKTKKELLAAKEKIMKIKRDTLKIVEMMLEEDVSKEWFLQNCGLLCQDDYQDVVQERSIEHLCGYPLCRKPIEKVLKQKYHISKATNKVYDLTERKCFCSNECYKASNFLKTQLPQLPLYMRKTEEPETINILQKCDNSGSAGDEIVFREIVTKDDIEKIYSDDTIPPNHLSNILQEDLKGCEEHLSKLEITEKVYKKPYIFGKEDQKNAEETLEKETSEASDQERSEGEDEERELFLEYDNVSALSNKHMPIPSGTKKTVLISPLKASTVPQSQPVKLSVDFFNNIFQDWFTEDTMKYLLGEKQLYSFKADLLFQTMLDDSASPERVSAAKDEYVDLCLKIDKLQKEELSDSDEFDIECVPVSSKEDVKDSFTIETHSKPIPKRKPRKTNKPSKDKTKSVSFAPDVKVEKIPDIKLKMSSEECNSVQTLPEPAFPLIDSLSQNGLRRKVLTSKLKTVYNDILPLIDLHYKDIRDAVNKMVETFSLTPTNVTFKPKELKIIAVVLFRILTKTALVELDDFNFEKLCEESISHLNVSSEDIENLTSDLISKEQVQRLQGASTVSKI